MMLMGCGDRKRIQQELYYYFCPSYHDSQVINRDLCVCNLVWKFNKTESAKADVDPID